MRMIIKITICTWVTSLVERVISEAVENLSNSVLEKLSTFLNTALRMSRAAPAAVRAARKPVAIVHAPPSSETSSIMPPMSQNVVSLQLGSVHAQGFVFDLDRSDRHLVDHAIAQGGKFRR